MITRQMFTVAMAMFLTGMTIGLPGTKAGGSDLRITAKLAGASINGMVPKGIGEFRSRAGSSQLKVQVENVNLAGATLNVLIDNAKVGELTISALLAGQMQLNTRDGEAVPPIGSGSTCVVTDQSGATIVAGTF